MSQFLDHLADDVMPALIEKLSMESKRNRDGESLVGITFAR